MLYYGVLTFVSFHGNHLLERMGVEGRKFCVCIFTPSIYYISSALSCHHYKMPYIIRCISDKQKCAKQMCIYNQWNGNRIACK